MILLITINYLFGRINLHSSYPQQLSDNIHIRGSMLKPVLSFVNSITNLMTRPIQPHTICASNNLLSNSVMFFIFGGYQ